MSTFKYETNATADTPDARDYIYQPSLDLIRDEQSPTDPLIIRDQGTEGACTGFALSAVINLLNQKRGKEIQVSPRMLYEMAKKNDEWEGEEYEGSSLRGAIKGWKNMGVCSETEYPYVTRGGMKHLTVSAAKDARKNTVGAYYRLLPETSHFHNAINEAGAVAVSAKVHKGWENPSTGKIIQSDRMMGGHAFAIVGYNDEGFLVQNSWGKKWGDEGTALWTYEDWIENVMDAWVVSLALPTPQVFGKQALSFKGVGTGEGEVEGFWNKVDRAEIAGHFVHIDDGEYHKKGRYWSDAEDVEETAELVAKAPNSDYQHLLFYFHGGLNSPKASARRIRAMKDGFKRNGVYPYHIMYDTGLLEELKDVIVRKGEDSDERVGGFADWTDRFLEFTLRRPGTLVWDEMKRGAETAFDMHGDGLDAVNKFIRHLGLSSAIPKKIHLVGHSTGAIVIAHLLRSLQNRKIEIASCSLLAPAATVDLFESHFTPIYEDRKKLTLGSLNLYNLKDRLEQDDNVAGVYRKSLLYLVSNSFQSEGRGTPIVGMENFSEGLTAHPKLTIHYSNGSTGSTTHSESHGGFDNDHITMNHVLKTILGGTPSEKFTEDELKKF